MTTESSSAVSVPSEAGVGEHLRRWRNRVGLSQMRVAHDCNVSTRHLSFVETGRARPSRELIVYLARSLGATNEELNVCLLAGGFAPRHMVELAGDLHAVSDALVEMIDRHNPYPAFVFSPDWMTVRVNAGGQWLCSVLMPDLWSAVADPRVGVDMLDALTRSDGLLSQMRNAACTGWALLRQLRMEQLTNPDLQARVDAFEASLLRRYPAFDADEEGDRDDPTLHLDFDTVHGPVSFFTVQSVIGMPQQVTVATPRVEMWFPADQHTRQVMARASA
ncbi:helix-turn-helix domain-containing protein [Mycolicibacterium arenosum]|uniref:Helix-turn-helix transcriptional regulator n=1 Tax=Mycolicibacterium arenosum TaxID=2952157 RepID=A0ABT1M157_9MYCO|nr:helix-turn-helix domain-containing protein [Mycolicibacterium sp. CAU 1645]MCP9271572.1 helix-turn-helix transcriptional regulator [Mycolicibacterium sp. CAU 1645]